MIEERRPADVHARPSLPFRTRPAAAPRWVDGVRGDQLVLFLRLVISDVSSPPKLSRLV
jgi:hypothetical protein